jgi:hypothetical protein
MRVLFTGYAPVHFLGFKPLYDEWVRLVGVEVSVAGGQRTVTPDGTVYDPQAMYGPLGVSAERMLSVPQIKDQDFDLLFCANTKAIAPRSVGRRIQIFHGMSFRNVAIREDNRDFDHYFVLGPYMQRGFETRELFEAGDPRAVRIGFMKTDRLLDGTLDRDEIPYLFAADLLVSDASSVTNEYALLDHPMVFLDVPKLIATARKKGSMVDLETWGRRLGLVAPDATSAVDAIAYALASPMLQSPIRRAAASDLFYNPGRATATALEWLGTELGVGG